MSAFSLVETPQLLPLLLQCRYNAPLPIRPGRNQNVFQSFGIPLIANHYRREIAR